MPNGGVSPDLGARLRESVMGCAKMAQFSDDDGAVHNYHHSDLPAINNVKRCAACWSILVAAIRAETLEEAAKLVEEPVTLNICGGESPMSPEGLDEIFRFALRIKATAIRALTGSQTPNG